ncbi:MAG: radical SAM protein [Candidatus Aureabacteria bacterium]|nr:radical SAM protein [Candidatus Auribacterota bacterium]
MSYRNFCWSLVWNITYVCNGRCLYCGVPKEKQHPDAFRVLDTLSGFSPKDLLLLGGEPMLHPDIVEIIPEAKKRLKGPSITLSTNLSLDEFLPKIQRILPFLDRLQVSMDALGEVNQRIRGINGDLILSRMVSISDFISRNGLECQLFTQSVVTAESMAVLEEFVKGVSKKIPGIMMGFAMVTPYDSPHSIARDRNALAKFIGIITRLRRERYNVNICDRLMDAGCGDIPSSSDRESVYDIGAKIAGAVRCRRQYFLAQVLPSGRLWRCKPEYFTDNYRRIVAGELGAGRYRNALRSLCDAVGKMVARKYGEICPFPCICNRYMEDILLADDVRQIPAHNLRRLTGRFTPQEIHSANRFLVRHYGRGISEAVASVLCGKKQQ